MKKLKTLALLLVIFSLQNVVAQTTPFSFNWNDKYQHTQTNGFSNEGRKVAVNPSNGFIYVLADVTSDLDPQGVASGTTYNYTMLLQYEPSGSLLNTAMLDVGIHSTSGFDRQSAFGLELDGSGNVYVGYNSNDDTTTFYNVNITKFSANLVQAWTYTFNPTSSDFGIDMKVNQTGTVYCLAKSIGVGGAVRYRIIRAAAAGSSALTYYNFTVTSDVYSSMAIDNVSNIYVAGHRPSNISGVGKVISVTSVIGTGASNGSVRWSQIDNCGTVTGDDIARHVIIGADGFVYITGSSVGTAQHGVDAVTMKLSATNGKKIWENFINYTLTDGGFFVNVPDIATVNVAWSSGSVVYLDQISPSTGLFSRRASYVPIPATPYNSLGQTNIVAMASSVGKNVYMTGTIAATNTSGQSFDAAWLAKFNFSSRGGARVENAAPIEGSFNQSKRAVGLALDNASTNVYWIRDLAENHSNHLQEKVEISSMEGTGSFRQVTELNDEQTQDRIVFANPVSDVLQISSVDQMTRVQVLDISGKILLESTPTSNLQTLEAQQLPAGVYHVVVVHNDGFTTIKPFVKH